MLAARVICGLALATMVMAINPLGFGKVGDTTDRCCGSLCKGQMGGGHGGDCENKCRLHSGNVKHAMAYFVCAKGLCSLWSDKDQKEFDEAKLSEEEMADLGDVSLLGLPSFMSNKSVDEAKSLQDEVASMLQFKAAAKEEVAHAQASVSESFCATPCDVCSELCSALQQPWIKWRFCKWQCMLNWKELNRNKNEFCKTCGGLYECGKDKEFKPDQGNGYPGCVDCPDGYMSEGAGYCYECPIGWAGQGRGQGCKRCDPQIGEYSNTTGAKDCLKCNNPAMKVTCVGDCRRKDKNKELTNGGSGCVQCGRGSEGGQGKDRDTCVDCAAGHNASKTSTCQECETGRYNIRKGEATCYLCPDGEQGTDKGQTTCKSCANKQSEGKHTGEKHLICEVCPAGKTPAKNLEKCNNCTKGQEGKDGVCKECNATAFKYADKEGQGECGTCGAGLEPASWTKPQNCQKCPAGKFNDGQMKRGECEKCPRGFYCEEGAKQAVKCDDGDSTWGEWYDVTHWFDNWGFATRSDCKKCPIGRFMNTSTVHWEKAQRDFEVRTCEKCPIATFGATAGLTTCTRCGGKNTTDDTGMTKASDCHKK